MKTNIILTLGLLTLTLGFIGCGAPAVNTTNANAKTANANTAVNTNAAAANTAPATDGQLVKIDEAGINITVPKGFKFSKDGEDTVVKTEDEGVDIRFTVPKDGDYDKAVADAVTELDQYLDNIKEDSKDPAKRTVDGMEAASLTGTAKDKDGDAVKWNLTIIKTPKKPVLVNIYAEQASLDKNAAAVKLFLDSVKKQ